MREQLRKVGRKNRPWAIIGFFKLGGIKGATTYTEGSQLIQRGHNAYRGATAHTDGPQLIQRGQPYVVHSYIQL